MKTYCFALDLKDDPFLIAEYDRWHQTENAWPEIRKSILDSGITDMHIYRTGNRLFMIMETNEGYSHEHKALSDAANPKVQEWEQLMRKFQQPIPWAKDNEKWVKMKEVFAL